MKQTYEFLISNTKFTKIVSNLVNRYSKKYHNRDKNDLASEAMLASIIAYRSYDDTYNTTFSTYAYPYMKHAIETFCKKNCHILSISEKAARRDMPVLYGIKTIDIDNHYNDNDLEIGQLEIPVSSGINYLSDTEDFFFSGLSILEKNIARDYFINELCMRQIATKYNISKSRTGSIISFILKKMRDKTERYEQDDKAFVPKL